MTHIYNDTFFDYIDGGARASARAFTRLLQPWLQAQSVIDFGSGRGVWLSEWQRAGAAEVLGVDGHYVNRQTLAIPEDSFRAADLTRPVDTGRRFDLAQSLEVGEHLPEHAAATLVDSLCAASDRVLFSAAVTGQGGEFHVNEQPLAYWQHLFALRGYRAYDCIRPAMAGNRDVEPWYRYNAILYVNEAGRHGLPDEVLLSQVPDGEEVHNGGDLKWRLRRGIVTYLPRGTVTAIAQVRARVLASLAARRTA